MKSLSRNSSPPVSSGNIELVATSKTPHPQAQPWAAPGARTTANRATESAISKTFLIFILLKSWLQGRQTAFLSWFLWKLPGTGEYAWLDLPRLISELAGDRPWRRDRRGFQPACHQREAEKWRF